MRKGVKHFAFFCAFFMLLWGCGTKEEEAVPQDNYYQGTIHISCDESFKPVIDAEVEVYENSFPGTKIIVHYKPEADCLRDMAVDSIRMVIATRSFSETERLYMLDSLNVQPTSAVVAKDAIAVVVHPSNPDSFFTLNRIRDLVSGKLKENLIPVFDGVKATSTVRFMLDSVLRNDNLGANVVAAQSSAGVIDYVAQTPNAVGFLGVSWVGNRGDTAQQSFLKKVRLARLESTDSTGGYVLPVQYLIYSHTYPMVRSLVYVLKERHLGLGTAFANFLKGQRGQLIFRRAYLQPAIYGFYIRDAELRTE